MGINEVNTMAKPGKKENKAKESEARPQKDENKQENNISQLNNISQSENMKQKVMEFQVLQKHSEQLAEQVQSMNQHLAELENAREAVQEAGKAENGTEVLVPVANGVFVKAYFGAERDFILGVGAETAVEKNSEEVLSMLTQQEGELREKVVEAEAILEQFHNRMRSIYEIININKKNTES
jgi:prefoldin alpha subunit